MTGVRVLDLPADKMDGEVIVAFIFTDQKPVRGAAALLDWRLNGILTRNLLEGTLDGVIGQRLVVMGGHRVNADWVMFFGCGTAQSLDAIQLENLLGQILVLLQQAGFRRVALAITSPFKGEQDALQKNVETFLVGHVPRDMECLLTFQGE